MKKIISLMFVLIFSSTSVFAVAGPVGATDNTQNIVTDNGQAVVGIKMNSTCLRNGQCSFKIYDLLGIRRSIETDGQDTSTSPTLFVQDIILSATFFIGTIVTVGIIVSGLMYIFAAASGKEPSKALSGLKYSIIGLLLVISSYAIIRLVQYIAKGL